uniref:Uncharacterized protein n=1 Tax=Brassica campestris TaxID=3711 RepID=M4EUW3_BRACM
MVDPTETEIVEVDNVYEDTILGEIQTVADEDEQTPTRGQVATGAGENAVTGAGGNAVTGAQGIFRTFFTWFVGLFPSDALPNDSEQEALLSSLVDGEPTLPVVAGGGNGDVAGGRNGGGAGGGNGVGAPGGGWFCRIWGSLHREGPNDIEAGSTAPKDTALVAPRGGWFRRIWGSPHREGPNDTEAGSTALDDTALVAPRGGWFRRILGFRRHREGPNDIEAGPAAPEVVAPVRVVKDLWLEFVGEANGFIKWVITSCFLFVPVNYLLKGSNDVTSTLSTLQLQLPTIFLPTVFSYVTCILVSKLFQSTKIKTVFQGFGIIMGVVACVEAFYFVGHEAHISAIIVMVVIIVATLITAVATMSNAKRLMVFNLSDTKVIVMCHPKVAKEILNSSQIKRLEEQRRMVVTQMVNAFTLNVGTVFEVCDLLKTASLCNMMGLVSGKEYELETNNTVESEYLKGLVEEWYDAELDPIIFLD